tara:strand:+ start:751 stop:1059 length:309 start_codon:yes stop_codon:yes gene_type:complete
MKIKEIKSKLQNEQVIFIIKGHTSYQKGKEGFGYGDYPTKFKTHISDNEKTTQAIFAEYKGMNVKKFGPTCVTLYTYDMLSKKILGKIKYADVTILEDEKEV